MGIEQATGVLREDQAALAAEVDGLDQPLVTEMAERVVVNVEVAFRYDTEGADGGQRTAVLAVQLVDTVTIDNQLALLAAREVEVVHQAVARVVIVPVALVVHARTAIGAFAQVIPSGVVHKPSRVLCECA